MRQQTHSIGYFIADVGLKLALGPPRRRALLIGIRSGIHVNRPDASEAVDSAVSVASLSGPHEDVAALKKLLLANGYCSSDIVILLDTADQESHLQPTHENVMRELDNLTMDQRSGDVFFFGYSGHSHYRNVPTESSHPRAKYIIPLDATGCLSSPPDYSKVIWSQVLKEKLVKPLLKGSRLTAVLDTCHSASLLAVGLELKHCKCNRIASWRSRIRRSVRWMRELFQTEKNEPPSSEYGLPRCGSCLPTMRDKLETCSGYCLRPWRLGFTPVLCISACKDSQVVYEDGEGRSLTRIFVDVLEDTPHPSLRKLMHACNQDSQMLAERMRKEDYEDCAPWHPQLSSLTPLNMHATFSL